MTTQIVRIVALLLASALCAPAVQAQTKPTTTPGPTRDDTEIERLRQDVARLTMRVDDLSESMQKMKEDQGTTLKLMTELTAAVGKLKDDVKSNQDLTDNRLRDIQGAIDQLSRTDTSSGRRILSREAIKNSPEVQEEIKNLIPLPPTRGRLRVFNDTGAVQHLYVNGILRTIASCPQETLIDAPVGVVTYRLGHESPRFTTIEAPDYLASTMIYNRAMAVNYR